MVQNSVGGKIIKYSILPRFDKVLAEIYYTKPNDDTQYFLISKEFGKFYRKPIEQDYKNALSWCLNQIDYITESNLK